jgi:hypothetical protein
VENKQGISNYKERASYITLKAAPFTKLSYTKCIKDRGKVLTLLIFNRI